MAESHSNLVLVSQFYDCNARVCMYVRTFVAHTYLRYIYLYNISLPSI